MIQVWLQVLGNWLCCDTGLVTGTWRQVAHYQTLATTATATERRVSSSQRRSSVCGPTNTARVQKLLKKVLESTRISLIMLGVPEATLVRAIQPADSGPLCYNYSCSVGSLCLLLPVYVCRLRFVCQSSDLPFFKNLLLWNRLQVNMLNLPPRTALPGADGRSRPA